MRSRYEGWVFAGGLAVLAAGVSFHACSSMRPEANIEVAPQEEGEQILISGGTVVRRDTPDEKLDLLLERHEGYLVLSAADRPGKLQARDTLDIGGLYIHSTDPFDATVDTTPRLRPGSLNIAMYVVRHGFGPGTPAMWLIGPYEVQRIDSADNQPPGSVDPRVGCYAVERGGWSEPDFEWDPQRMPIWFPDTLRLHWQLHWPYGPDSYLVATDASGRVRGNQTARYGWWPVGRDSLGVGFGAWYMGIMFRGAPNDGGFEGELAVYSDVGSSLRAPARLRRLECPAAN